MTYSGTSTISATHICLVICMRRLEKLKIIMWNVFRVRRPLFRERISRSIFVSNLGGFVKSVTPLYECNKRGDSDIGSFQACIATQNTPGCSLLFGTVSVVYSFAEMFADLDSVV